MTERQKKVLAIAERIEANELTKSVIEYANVIAEECLVKQLYVNGVLVYEGE